MVKIGRYELVSIEEVRALCKRDDGSGYDAILANGARLWFTDAERDEYIAARKLHDETIQVMGMMRGIGARV